MQLMFDPTSLPQKGVTCSSHLFRIPIITRWQGHVNPTVFELVINEENIKSW